MKIKISKTDGRPAYMQLYSQLRDDIVSGALPSGSKLPSKRMLADESEVSVITAEHAYAMLLDEGYVISVERSGYYVASDGAIFPRSAKNEGKASGVSEHSDISFPFTPFARAMRRVLADYGDGILVKSPPSGTAELRCAIAEYLARFRGIKTSSEQIVVGAGAEYLYSLLVQLLGKERIYGIENPSYEKIAQVYEANGVRTELLALGADGIGTDALKSTTATVLHVTPYHSFPSGVSASPKKRREYVEWAEARDGYVIEDDFDSEFFVTSKPADTVYSMCKSGRTVYLNTFSKSLAPSMRVGYMVLPEGLACEFKSRLGFYSCTVSVYEQLVIADFLSSGEFERHINRERRKLRAERAHS